MGSKWWFAHGGWAGSVEATLETVQSAFLESKDFLAHIPPRDALLAMAETMLSGEFPMPNWAREQLRTAVDRLGSDGRPATRFDAVILTSERLGTGTVLDIDGVHPDERAPDDPPLDLHGPLLVASLPTELLERLFDTAEPAMNEIIDRERALAELPIPRHGGRYVVAYEGGSPSGVAFFGWSGD